MSKCVLIMGKTCSGKDYTMNRILKDYGDKFHKALQHTTRPMRDGEENLKDYIFHSHFPLEENVVPYSFDDDMPFQYLRVRDKNYERRTFRTNHGDWDYWTDFSEFDKDKTNIIIGDYHMCNAYYEQFSDFKILYNISSDSDRLQRYLCRTDNTMHQYDEICRRNRRDDFDHKHFFNVNLKPDLTPICILVGDIDPTEYVPSLLAEKSIMSHVFYHDKNGKLQKFHFYKNHVEYNHEDNILMIGDKIIDFYTLEVRENTKLL